MLESLSKSSALTCLSVAEVALLAMTALVVVGLIGEYAKADRWKKWLRTFEVLVVVGVAGEMLAESATFLVSGRLESIHDDEMVGAQREVEQLRAANLELEKRMGPRFLDRAAFVAALLGKPTASAEVWYQRDDTEAYLLAVQIVAALGAGPDGAGWRVGPPTSMPSPASAEPLPLPNAPAVMRYGAWYGVGVRTGQMPDDSLDLITFDEPKTVLGTLLQAFRKGGLFVGQTTLDSSLNDGFVIVIGPKQ